MSQKLPLVVIVGRPNVGKSTLFNRLTGTRRSIVTDEPGITRDRIYGTADWEGRAFEVVDTGGLLPGDKAAIPREIFRQAKVAIEDAAQLLLVVDARSGVTPLDADLARLLRTSGKPLAIVANKVDTLQQEPLAAPFYKLGKVVYPVSAEHGYGVDVLLDAITRNFPRAEARRAGATRGAVLAQESLREAGAEAGEDVAAGRDVDVAIIGRPNVGKSTLLNNLVGEERAIVLPEPGTTRDAVDTVVRRGEKTYLFIDTAGIRRKGKTKLVAEKLSVIMARKHLERSDVALLVVDAKQGVTSGDATIAGYAQESGRSIIVVMNKWDAAVAAAAKKAAEEAKRAPAASVKSRAVAGKRARWARGPSAQPSASAARASALLDPSQLMRDYEQIVRQRLKFLDYAPVVFLSALTGEHVPKLYALIDRVAAARRRIPTGELNRWLAEVDLERGTSPGARKVKIFYITQASNSPPTFVLFTNQTERLHFSYERFLENRLRERFEFTGAPIRFLQRLKEKRSVPARRAGN